jgi:hypothetical protein
MSLSLIKAFCLHHTLKNTEITPGFISKPKIRKKKYWFILETAARCRTPGCLDSVSITMEFSSYVIC